MAYSDTEIQDKATQLIQAGVGEDDVRNFINTAKAEQGATQETPDNPDINPEKEGIMAGLAAASPFPLKGASATGLRVAAPAVGQMIGGPIGGAIGGGLGEAGAQALEGEFKPGQIIASAGLGAIPGSSLAKAGVGGVVKEGVKFGLGNLAAKTVETAVDEGRPISMPEAALSFAGGAIAAPIAKGLDKGANALQQRSIQKQIQNEMRDKTLAAAQAAGYVIPPSKVNPTPINNILESFAGKAATGQEAAIRNQEITNALAKKAVGLPVEAPLTEDVLRDIRAEAAAPYKQIAAISPKAAQDLEKLKDARFEATARFKQYARDANPDTLRLARAADVQATQLESTLEQHAKDAGIPNVIPDLKKARVLIAKTHEVERALNLGDYNVEASKLGRSVGRLTDELDLIARFQKAFPAYTRAGATVPPAGVSKLRTYAPLFYGAAGYAGLGPAGFAAAAIPLAEAPTRAGLLSRFGQKLLANPRYSSTPDVQAILARFGTMDATRAPSLPQPSQ